MGSTPTLTIVMPTISGREAWLERATESFAANTHVPVEFIVLTDMPTCGLAWQAGGEQAVGDYIYMAADDVEAMPGWDVAAIEACDRGVLPAPIVYNPDMGVQSCGERWGDMMPDGAKTQFTRAPFMSRAQWEIAQPMLPVHYYTDNWVSWKCWQAGIPTVVTHGFRLIHHLAKEGRNESRMGSDGCVYMAAVAGEDVWHASS